MVRTEQWTLAGDSREPVRPGNSRPASGNNTGGWNAAIMCIVGDPYIEGSHAVLKNELADISSPVSLTYSDFRNARLHIVTLVMDTKRITFL